MTTLILQCFLLVCIAITATDAISATEKGPAGDEKMRTALGLGELDCQAAREQKPVNLDFQKFANAKIMLLNGYSSLNAKRKKAASLKEGMLDLWVYMPSGNVKTIRPDDDMNCFFAGIGTPPVKINADRPIVSLMAALIRFSQEANGLGASGSLAVNHSLLSLYSIYDFTGWHRLGMCFKDKYTAIYVDGIIMRVVEIDPDTGVASLLPAKIDEILLSNGVSAHKNSSIGTIGIGSVLLADRCLNYGEMRKYQSTGELPEGAHVEWEITFDKGKPKAKSTRFDKSGNIKFSKVD